MQQANVVIANGASLSGEIDLQHFLPCGIIMPSAWTAASLTFAGAPENGAGGAGTFVPITNDAGTEYTVTVAASKAVMIDPVKLAGVRYLKIRSGTSSAAVTQGADRTLNVILRNE
jgi:hypothetical protein